MLIVHASERSILADLQAAYYQLRVGTLPQEARDQLDLTTLIAVGYDFARYQFNPEGWGKIVRDLVEQEDLLGPWGAHKKESTSLRKIGPVPVHILVTR